MNEEKIHYEKEPDIISFLNIGFVIVLIAFFTGILFAFLSHPLLREFKIVHIGLIIAISVCLVHSFVKIKHLIQNKNTILIILFLYICIMIILILTILNGWYYKIL